MRSLIVFCLLATVCFLSCCAPSRELSLSARDSIRVEIVERRVVVHDTVVVEVPFVQEHVVVRDSSTLSNPLARSQAVIQADGTLFHSLETIAQSIEYPVENHATVRDSVIYTLREVVKIIEVPRELSQWQQFQIYGFWLLVALFLVLCWFLLR